MSTDVGGLRGSANQKQKQSITKGNSLTQKVFNFSDLEFTNSTWNRLTRGINDTKKHL